MLREGRCRGRIGQVSAYLRPEGQAETFPTLRTRTTSCGRLFNRMAVEIQQRATLMGSIASGGLLLPRRLGNNTTAFSC